LLNLQHTILAMAALGRAAAVALGAEMLRDQSPVVQVCAEADTLEEALRSGGNPGD
jgi:hypothetical protein